MGLLQLSISFFSQMRLVAYTIKHITVGDLQLVIGSKCSYEINRCTDASCGNEILIDIIHLAYQFACFCYMFMFQRLDLVPTLLFFYHNTLPLTNSLSVSQPSSSFSPSFRWIWKSLANLSSLSLLWNKLLRITPFTFHLDVWTQYYHHHDDCTSDATI
jgi:hypothetical protein